VPEDELGFAAVVPNDDVLANDGNLSILRYVPRSTDADADPQTGGDRITIEPGKRGGKPCIRGLRITVSDVLDYLASGMSDDDLLRDFPDLTREDIRACLAFAADRERRLVAVGER